MKKLARLVFAPTFTLALATALALGATACSGAGSAQTAQSAAATTRAPVGQGTHGLVKVAGEALGEVDLRPEQRVEIEKLAQAAEARHSALRADLKVLMLDIADQVEKGAIDRAQLKPKVDQAIAKMDQARPGDQAALGQLHALLDDGQRAAFVDALKAHGKERMTKHGGHPLMALAHDLDLSSEQRDKIREAFKDGMRAAHAGAEHGEHGPRWGGHHGRGHGMLEAFKQPQFDPAASGPQGSLAERAKGKEDAAFAVAEKVLPLLSAEQRKILATKIRARANAEDPTEGF